MLRDDHCSSGIVALTVLLFATITVAAPQIETPKVESFPGSDVKRVVLDASEAKRLDIQTAPLREEKVVRQMTVIAEVENEPAAAASDVTDTSSPAASKPAPNDGRGSAASPMDVHVLLDTNGDDDADDDVGNYDDEDDAEIWAPGDIDEVEPLRARRVTMTEGVEKASDPLYFKVRSGTQRGLAAGQRVAVKLAAPGSGTPKKVVPYSAVLYALSGDAWVYTSPEPLVFVRRQVTIEHIDQDSAILSDGPAVGTQVVTVGAAELYGAESRVKH